MKILGIGNAIVDVICRVEDIFLKNNELTKGTMKLVDENEFKKLLSNLKIEETISGGSVANSIVGLSYLGNNVGFIGKINKDDLGNKYEEGLKKEKVKYFYSKKKEKLPTGTCLILITPDSERTMCTFLGTAGKINEDNLGSKYEEGLKKEKVEYFYSKKKEDLPTGTCLILITPDSERTMCTFLGTAGKINENDVDLNAIKNSEITFLEGYLWDEGDPKKAFNKAIQNSNKVAMSLSDLFCVERHKTNFLDLVKNKLDITFANEQEILSLINSKNFNEVIDFGKQIGKLIVITRGEKGSIAIYKDEITECNIQKNLKIVDLTGAGDLFAAGFLHGYINNLSLEESLKKGTDMSSKIIQKIGARLN